MPFRGIRCKSSGKACTHFSLKYLVYSNQKDCKLHKQNLQYNIKFVIEGKRTPNHGAPHDCLFILEEAENSGYVQFSEIGNNTFQVGSISVPASINSATPQYEKTFLVEQTPNGNGNGRKVMLSGQFQHQLSPDYGMCYHSASIILHLV